LFSPEQPETLSPISLPNSDPNRIFFSIRFTVGTRTAIHSWLLTTRHRSPLFHTCTKFRELTLNAPGLTLDLPVTANPANSPDKL
jgi:hypothetical protein